MSNETQSGNVPLVHKQIHAAMGEVAAVAKGLTVSTGGGSYKAVSHDDVVSAVRPAFQKHGLTCMLSITDAKEERYEVTNKNGYTRTEYRVTLWADVTFTAISDGSQIVVRAFGIGVDSGDKGAGKAISYAKKYALLTCLLLATGEDVDMHASEDGLRSQTQLEKAQDNSPALYKQAIALFKEADAAGLDVTPAKDKSISHAQRVKLLQEMLSGME